MRLRRPETQPQNQRPSCTSVLVTRNPCCPTTPAVQMVAPAPEEGSGEGEATPHPSEESDSGKSYEAMQDDTTISQGNVEIAVRAA